MSFNNISSTFNHFFTTKKEKPKDPFIEDSKGNIKFHPDDFSIGSKSDIHALTNMCMSYSISRMRYASMGAITNETAAKDIKKATELMEKFSKFLLEEANKA